MKNLDLSLPVMESVSAMNISSTALPSTEPHALTGPEYYAVFLKPAASITFGGLEIDIAAKVLDKDGKVIPGLFASGEVANTGNFGHGVPSYGYSLGHALHFGRLAARSACEKELL